MLIILEHGNNSKTTETSQQMPVDDKLVGEKIEILQFTNYDLTNVVTPVNVDEFQKLLKLSKFNGKRSEALINGFKFGFSIGYEGETEIQQKSAILKLFVGSKIELWNKVMKEVGLKCFAGPFGKIPFKNYIQSPIGLVPKDGRTKTHLIFHLLHLRLQKGVKQKSVNTNTPRELCNVNYASFDDAITLCIAEGKSCHIAKSDMDSAFRNLGIKAEHWPYLVMKAESPIDGKTYYFVDKCLPFGASISCALFQEFLDAVAHIVKFFTKKPLVNYLDDYFFAALLKAICNSQVSKFLEVCEIINFPVSAHKTFWGTTRLWAY